VNDDRPGEELGFADPLDAAYLRERSAVGYRPASFTALKTAL